MKLLKRLQTEKGHVCTPWEITACTGQPAMFGDLYECSCGRQHVCIGPGLENGGFSPERWRRVHWWGVWSR
jgi:hypothetical protein